MTVISSIVVIKCAVAEEAAETQIAEVEGHFTICVDIEE